MKVKMTVPVLVSLMLLIHSVANAHFGMVIPSDNMVMPEDSRMITLDLSFSHPFEMIGMDLVKPAAFMVFHDGKHTDLMSGLQKRTVMDHSAWRFDYTVKRPGAHTFVMEPQPYWEPAEDCYIVHYTKTCVAAFGDDTGWDAEIGLKTEIVPLAKPFGLWAGNVFQGIVKMNGKPIPYAEVEVEYYNQTRQATAPTDYMITQTIKADANGVFTYSVPVPGWWGFAALNTSDKKKVHKGEKKDIELGAVIWIKFENWQEK